MLSVAVIETLDPLEASRFADAQVRSLARTLEPDDVSADMLEQLPAKVAVDPELVSTVRLPAEISATLTLDPEEVSIDTSLPERPVPVTVDPEDVSSLESCWALIVTLYFSLYLW